MRSLCLLFFFFFFVIYHILPFLILYIYSYIIVSWRQRSWLLVHYFIHRLQNMVDTNYWSIIYWWTLKLRINMKSSWYSSSFHFRRTQVSWICAPKLPTHALLYNYNHHTLVRLSGWDEPLMNWSLSFIIVWPGTEYKLGFIKLVIQHLFIDYHVLDSLNERMNGWAKLPIKLVTLKKIY